MHYIIFKKKIYNFLINKTRSLNNIKFFETFCLANLTCNMLSKFWKISQNPPKKVFLSFILRNSYQTKKNLYGNIIFVTFSN